MAINRFTEIANIEQRIGATAGAILVLLILLTGAAFFSILSRQLNAQLESSLIGALNDKESFFHNKIDTHVEMVEEAIARRPQLIKLLHKFNAGDARKEEMRGIGAILENISIKRNVSAIELLDARGQRISSRGEFLNEPAVTVTLHHPENTTLLWKGQFFLQIASPVLENGTPIGTLRIETPLPNMTKVLQDYTELGQTGEIRICGALPQHRMNCFPSRLSRGGNEPQHLPNGVPLPMSKALEGENGTDTTLDYRQQEAFFAYRSLGNSGLGIIIKMDTRELEQPIWERLLWITPFLAALAALGVGLLRWQVKPLVRAIAASNDRVNAIMDSTADGLITIDEHGIIESFNISAARLFGYSPFEAIGKNVSMLMPESLRNKHIEGMQIFLRTGVTKFIGRGALEIQGQRKDGSLFPLELTLGEMILNDKRLFIGSLRDTSELQQAHTQLESSFTALKTASLAQAESAVKLQDAQNQLLQSEKMASIGQLAAGVAHEINNPIGYVNSNLASLDSYITSIFGVVAAYEQSEHAITDSAALSRVQIAKKSADLDFLRQDITALMAESREGITRVKQIVQDLKDFSHVDEAEWQWIDLHRGLDATLNIVWNELKYKVEVIKEYGSLPEIECFPSQLNQVFMNLLVNAGHAIEERGTITIRTGAENEQVWVEIADSGKGIAPEHLTRIFEPFFTTKPVGKGTGLGLSVSYSIVQKHHGRIEVESEIGKGTTFRVWLPISHADA